MPSSKNVSGLKELAALMRQLAPNVAKKHMRAAVRAGATVIRKEARVQAPKDSGEMAKDIMVKREREAKDAALWAAKYSVFVLTGKKSRLKGKRRNVDRDSFYWRFVELGTSKMPPNPFMRRSYEAKKEEAVDEIAAKLDKGIQESVKELRR